MMDFMTTYDGDNNVLTQNSDYNLGLATAALWNA